MVSLIFEDLILFLFVASEIEEYMMRGKNVDLEGIGAFIHIGNHFCSSLFRIL
jgi:hypothetical protein